METKDPYRILQVARYAEQEVIEAAYRRLARKYHPDVNHAPDAHQRMQGILPPISLYQGREVCLSISLLMSHMV